MFKKLFSIYLLVFTFTTLSFAQFEVYPVIDKFEIGVSASLSAGFSNIMAEPSWSAGVHFRNTLTDIISVRASLIFHNIQGLDNFQKEISSPIIQEIYTNNLFVNNYLNQTIEASGELLFSRHTDKYEVFGGLGLSLLHYNVYVNALDRDEIPYDFTALLAPIGGRPAGIELDNYTIIRATMDESYEAQVVSNKLSLGFPIVLGMNFYITKKISIGYETRGLFSFSGFLDGYSNNDTNNNEMFLSASIRISTNLH